VYYNKTFYCALISAFYWLIYRNRPLALEMTNKLPRHNSAAFYRVFIIELYHLNQQTLLRGSP